MGFSVLLHNLLFFSNDLFHFINDFKHVKPIGLRKMELHINNVIPKRLENTV